MDLSDDFSKDLIDLTHLYKDLLDYDTITISYGDNSFSKSITITDPSIDIDYISNMNIESNYNSKIDIHLFVSSYDIIFEIYIDSDRNTLYPVVSIYDILTKQNIGSYKIIDIELYNSVNGNNILYR